LEGNVAPDDKEGRRGYSQDVLKAISEWVSTSGGEYTLRKVRSMVRA